MPLNVWILFVAQALAMCAAPLMVFAGALASKSMAPSPEWATVPVASLVVGTACTVYPAARLAGIWGRKRLFMAAMILGAVASLSAMWALQQASFIGFTIATTVVGSVIAVGQQFRFAAMESVERELMPVAASRILAAGLISAWLGPELVPLGHKLIAAPFAGAFVLLAILYLLTFVVIAFAFKTPQIEAKSSATANVPAAQIWRRSGFWVAAGSAAVGYGIMSFIMTATPISMHEMQSFSLEETKWVIQSHIIAMFLPSLFAGQLVKRLGHVPMIQIGLAVMLACAVLGMLDQSYLHYWWALLLLGVAWNFLFVAGTALLPMMHSPEEAPRAQGLNDLMVFSTQALGALSSGIVLYWLGWNGLLLITLPVTVGLVLFVWSWSTGKRTRLAE
ncbi:MAG: MFS transporter [Endozoicomonas sp.]